MATTISLVMMLVVVTIIGRAGTSIATSRATLEMSDRLRETQSRLAQDLAGVTVRMTPPRNPAANEGYFEYLEGPIGVVRFDPANPRQIVDPALTAANTATEPNFPVVPVTDQGQYDTTVGDNDDLLMFTTHSESAPFVGLLAGGTIQSPDAEVAWFVRGHTLYRRVLLVAPNVTPGAAAGFYAQNDISVRNLGGTLVRNTLGDLTNRENRFAHQGNFPCDIRNWGQLRLPTLAECSDATSSPAWTAGSTGPITVPTPFARSGATPIDAVDYWRILYAWQSLATSDATKWNMVDLARERLSAYPGGTRAGEDIVLTNVIGFDVKAWDPDAPILRVGTGPAIVPGDPGYLAALAGGATMIGRGAFVDLNYTDGTQPSLSSFAGPGQAKPIAAAFGTRALNQGLGWTYDTWSTSYENDGVDQDGVLGADQGSNGFDDDGNGIVDDDAEQETTTPYPVTLRGIQVKIRVFEPDSRQVREVTLVQKF